MLIVRTLGAVLAGLILMGITVVLVETVGYSTYPVPESLDDASARYAEAQVAALEGTAEADEVQGAKEALRAAIADYIETAPTGALLFVVFAWIAGGFVGGAVAGEGVELRHSERDLEPRRPDCRSGAAFRRAQAAEDLAVQADGVLDRLALKHEA